MANSLRIVRGKVGTGFKKQGLSNAAKKWTSDTIQVDANHTTTLKTTLVWSDPPGAKIINELLLEVFSVTHILFLPGNPQKSNCR